MTISGDGRRAASGSWDRTVRVWDLEGNRPPRILKGHTSAVWAVALSSDCLCAVSGSEDDTVRVWDLGGSQPPHALEGHTGGVTISL